MKIAESDLIEENLDTFTSSWEPMIPFTEIETPEIPVDVLPAWAGAFVREVSACAQTPPAFGVMMCFAVLSACLQKRYAVSPFGDDYRESVNIWALGVMPPGARKTFVVDQVTAPLVDWEREQGIAVKHDVDEAEVARTIALKRIERLQAEAAKEDDSIQRQALMHEICSLREAMPQELRQPRLFTNDCTPERFQSLLVSHGERMAVLSDEGGIFNVMSGLYSDGKFNIDVFLKSHAGSAVRVDRGGREAHLHAPLSTFGLAVQPSIIEELGRGNQRKFRGNGCLARFLYCIPRSNVGSRNLILRREITQETRARYADGIRSLVNIPPQVCEGLEQPRILRLDPEALLSWQAYAQALEARQAETGDLHSIADWTAKLPGAILRLAGLSHIVENGPDIPVISRATIERTIDLADILIEHALCAFDLMGAEQSISDAQYVARRIQKGPSKIKQTDIYRSCHGRIPRMERLRKALEVLIERNILSDAIVVQTGGRPSTWFYVNPEVHGGNQ